MHPIRMENPLVGTFNRERSMLVFRQRSLEFFASIFGMTLGAAMVFIAVGQQYFGLFWGILFPLWNFFFGSLFLVASAIAYLGFRSIRFDLRKRMYQERCRIGFMPKLNMASIDEISHLELAPYGGIFPSSLTQTAAPRMVAAPIQYGQLFVVRMYWKDPRRSPVVLEHVQTELSYGQIDRSLMNFAQKAQQYSNALGISLYSNVQLPGMTRIS